ncbi:hypothetical protein JW835_03200 [bacterium]|nr:hypothetical protein [bacterium]
MKTSPILFCGIMILIALMMYSEPAFSQSDSFAMNLLQGNNTTAIKEKSPIVAALFSCCLTSAGHAYAGNWKRGLNYTAVRLSFAALAAASMALNDDDDETAYFAMGCICIISLAEIEDAFQEAKRYNDRLFQKNSGIKQNINLGLNVNPKRSALALKLAYSF